ncbi:MAG: glycosyltransferase [Candidatus Coprovivens sp.]
MKILLVNKFHWPKGGSEKYYFELGELLKKHGHEVAYFSMEDEKNIKTGDKEYFVPKFDLNNSSKLKALNVILNKKNGKIMEQALDEFKPDVVHLNNFQRQLSASIIKPCLKRNIPIVFTAHDVQAICPAITMMDNDKKTCELCMKGKYMNCVKKSCNKGSKLKSIIGALEGYYYRINKIYTDKISYIITPSEFYRTKFIEDGVNPNKIQAIHNSIEMNNYNVKTEDEGYALYFGRLSKEKGILNLINAFVKTNGGKLYIAGEGPEKETIENIVKKNKLEDRVKLLGFLNKEQMTEYTRKCKFVVVPSIWYENCPYSILETLAIGKPVIGAKIGGIPELISHEENGFVYETQSELTDYMNKLFEDDKLVKSFCKKSKELAEKLYSRDVYYNKLEKIYNDVLKGVK